MTFFQKSENFGTIPCCRSFVEWWELINSRDCRLPSSRSQSRGVKNTMDDDFFFKNIHFHRDVPGQPLANSPSAVIEGQVKQLVIDLRRR